jgi:hypothetical protein
MFQLSKFTTLKFCEELKKNVCKLQNRISVETLQNKCKRHVDERRNTYHSGIWSQYKRRAERAKMLFFFVHMEWIFFLRINKYWNNFFFTFIFLCSFFVFIFGVFFVFIFGVFSYLFLCFFFVFSYIFSYYLFCAERVNVRLKKNTCTTPELYFRRAISTIGPQVRCAIECYIRASEWALKENTCTTPELYFRRVTSTKGRQVRCAIRKGFARTIVCLIQCKIQTCLQNIFL